MTVSTRQPVLAAIDVGTNAARLELARLDAEGLPVTFLKERNPLCPGEGVFTQGRISDTTAQRLVDTLRRYAALCQRHQARVRAVATSALRDATNQAHLVRRVREETGLELEVISGETEARLICLGVLHGVPPGSRSLLVDMGGGSTEVVLATGSRPEALWSLPLGGVRLTALFDTSGEVSAARLRRLGEHVDARLRESLPVDLPRLPRVALGSSGTLRNVVRFASAGGEHASVADISRAVEALVSLSSAQRREHFEPPRAQVIVAGAVLLERWMLHLGVARVTAVRRGLRDGVLVELGSRDGGGPMPMGPSLAPARGPVPSPAV